MGWVGLGPRIFDLPNVGLGTYFRQLNLPNNPLGQGNPSGQPYRTGTLIARYLPGCYVPEGFLEGKKGNLERQVGKGIFMAQAPWPVLCCCPWVTVAVPWCLCGCLCISLNVQRNAPAERMLDAG